MQTLQQEHLVGAVQASLAALSIHYRAQARSCDSGHALKSVYMLACAC